MNKEILNNIRITEESVLTLFKEKTTIEKKELLQQAINSNIKTISQEYPELILNEKSIKEIHDIVLNRIKNLCRKRYIVGIKFKTTDDENWLDYYTKLDITDIGNIPNKEVVIRSGRDKTILYYNDKEENDIVEVTIKTEAKLDEDSFLNVDVLDFNHKDCKYYNIYKVIFMIQPFTKLEILTDKNHKCFQSVDIRDPYTELYRYYGMKVFINCNKLIKFSLKGGVGSITKLHNLTISNLSVDITSIDIFSNSVKKQNLVYKDLYLPSYSRTEIDLTTMNDSIFYAYFTNHDKCIILNGNETIYEPKRQQ